MKQTTGSLIREQRLRYGMTQQQLADKLTQLGAKCTDSQISKFERGMHMPYPRLRAALAEVLNLDIDLQKVEVDA